MSSLALLVVVLLVVVAVQAVALLVYLAFRHPRLATPLAVGLTGVAVLAAIVVPIAIR